MADLGDFFAKRDKKKSKGKKFDTTDDLAKVLEQKVKEKKKLETGKSSYLQEGGRTSPGPGLPSNDDDEWLEAEDKKPDYTGLKIQELVLSDDDDVETKSQDGRASGDDSAKDGPWKKKSQSKSKDEDGDNAQPDETNAETKSETKTEEKTETPENGNKVEDTEVKDEDSKGTEDKKYVPPNKLQEAPKAAYVPPSRRAGAASSSNPTAPMVSKKKGTGAAPTLADEESFPTLS